MASKRFCPGGRVLADWPGKLSGEARARTTLDDAVSLGVHESQSRMWENLVGRSKDWFLGNF